jgi:hypothetical protein
MPRALASTIAPRHLARLALGVAALMLLAPAYASAAADPCPADAQLWLQPSGGQSVLSGSGAYGTRSSCPWFIVDFMDGNYQGQQLYMEGGWDLLINNEYDCNHAIGGFSIYRNVAGDYQYVDGDWVMGTWQGGFCKTRLFSGRSSVMFNGTNNQYRMRVLAVVAGNYAPVWGWGFLTRRD